MTGCTKCGSSNLMGNMQENNDGSTWVFYWCLDCDHRGKNMWTKEGSYLNVS